MAGPLKLVQKGDHPTLQSARKVNELYKVVNKLAELKVEPPTVGLFKDSPESYILDLTKLEQFVEDKVNEILDTLTVEAECGSNGSITITLSRG